MILTDELTYPAVIRAMETGEMYASSGPSINELYLEDETVHIECSPASQIILFTGTKTPKYMRAAANETLTSADLPLSSEASYFRVSVIDKYGNTACTRGFFADEYR